MIKVLFVCLGNICRSPMAEAIMNKLVKDNNLQDKIYIDSCAIGPWHIGQKPFWKTLETLKKNKIDSNGLIARRIEKKDGEIFDYIIGMDNENIYDIKNVIDSKYHNKVSKLLSFAGLTRDVDDPYYSLNFDTCYKDVEFGCLSLLEYLRKELNNESSFTTS